MVLVNWTRVSEGVIQTLPERGTTEHELLGELLDAILSDFEVEGELLFEQGLAFHTTRDRVSPRSYANREGPTEGHEGEGVTTRERAVLVFEVNMCPKVQCKPYP